MDADKLGALIKARNEADRLYQTARAEAKKVATAEFDRIFDETGDAVEAMQAYNTVMENLTGRK